MGDLAALPDRFTMAEIQRIFEERVHRRQGPLPFEKFSTMILEARSALDRDIRPPMARRRYASDPFTVSLPPMSPSTYPCHTALAPAPSPRAVGGTVVSESISREGSITSQPRLLSSQPIRATPPAPTAPVSAAARSKPQPPHRRRGLATNTQGVKQRYHSLRAAQTGRSLPALVRVVAPVRATLTAAHTDTDSESDVAIRSPLSQPTSESECGGVFAGLDDIEDIFTAIL